LESPAPEEPKPRNLSIFGILVRIYSSELDAKSFTTYSESVT
jgi:hypothetical protein